MSSRLRKLWPLVATVPPCCAMAVYAALSPSIMGDYVPGGAVGGDNAAPAIDALAHGDLAAYAAHQPLMGPVSLVLRAPIVALASALGAGQLVSYQLGVLACLVPVAGFAAWLAHRCASEPPPGRSAAAGWVAGAVAVGLLLLGHTTLEAIRMGHPEEPLTAVLATVAVLAAMRGRPLLAGVVLGAAVATKEWALIAVVPVLLALPRGRVRAAAWALGVAAGLTAPVAIANPHALAHAGGVLAGRRDVTPLSIWWPLGHPLEVFGAPAPMVRTLPSALTRLHLAELLLALGAASAWLVRRRSGGSLRVRDPLALLALLGLVRYLGDPLPQQYYLEALLVPLATWEVLVVHRLPLLRTAASAFVAIVAADGAHLSAAAMSALTILCGTALAVHLIRRLLPDGGDRPAGVSSDPRALIASRLIARGR